LYTPQEKRTKLSQNENKPISFYYALTTLNEIHKIVTYAMGGWQ
jgi:hypothetical protein